MAFGGAFCYGLASHKNQKGHRMAESTEIKDPRAAAQEYLVNARSYPPAGSGRVLCWHTAGPLAVRVGRKADL